jgi:hypothetical protein
MLIHGGDRQLNRALGIGRCCCDARGDLYLAHRRPQVRKGYPGLSSWVSLSEFASGRGQEQVHLGDRVGGARGML